jgi:hypothetical protein
MIPLALSMHNMPMLIVARARGTILMINEDPIILDEQTQPQNTKALRMMIQFLKRKNNIAPNKSDGFDTNDTNTGASSGPDISPAN